MLREMIKVQWLRSRIVALFAALLLFTFPLLVVRLGPPGELYNVGMWLRNAELMGRMIPTIMLLYGMTLAALAWSDDTKGNHVYALSLPLPRERFIVYRFLAQLPALVLAPAGLLVGAFVAMAAVTLPSGVHAYPVALALRALLAGLTCYAIFFVIANSPRRAGLILCSVVGGLVAIDLLLGAVGVDDSVLGTVGKMITTWPGPLAILTGRWALFDV
jgi:hypothetical protein